VSLQEGHHDLRSRRSFFFFLGKKKMLEILAAKAFPSLKEVVVVGTVDRSHLDSGNGGARYQYAGLE
jgi:hypothetical protein